MQFPLDLRQLLFVSGWVNGGLGKSQGRFDPTPLFFFHHPLGTKTTGAPGQKGSVVAVGSGTEQIIMYSIKTKRARRFA
jgi:hypothetical protein